MMAPAYVMDDQSLLTERSVYQTSHREAIAPSAMSRAQSSLSAPANAIPSPYIQRKMN
jgi:hypothetical protein